LRFNFVSAALEKGGRGSGVGCRKRNLFPVFDCPNPLFPIPCLDGAACPALAGNLFTNPLNPNFFPVMKLWQLIKVLSINSDELKY
jgi:hypothetical protein